MVRCRPEFGNFDKNGVFIKTWGGRGSAPGQFDAPHSLVVDTKGNVYVGDRNNRIQVFDTDDDLKTLYDDVGSPWAVCLTRGRRYLLLVSFPTGTIRSTVIYKMELDGTFSASSATAASNWRSSAGCTKSTAVRSRSLRRGDHQLARAETHSASRRRQNRCHSER